MASSRLPNFGTIFSRTAGLLQSGALKEKPIWFDVYRKYPPALEPKSERPAPPQDPIPEIVYEEDFERAKSTGNLYKTDRTRKSSSKLSSMNIMRELNQK